AAAGLAERLRGSDFTVRGVDEKPYRRSPYAPFMTSTLQQEAGRKLRYGSQRTMSIAQRLYENGYITYMRTDSTTLSETALTAARDQVRQLYGPDYVPDKPRHYDKKVKNAQEAHEAIRPAGDRFRTPDEVAQHLPDDELRLYDLIWKRTVASQMTDARGRSVQVRLGGTSSAEEDAEFAASGKIIDFPGFMRAYVEGSDDPEAALEDQEVRLPPVAEGTALDVVDLEPKGHQTQPPARFTEASLVKALEEMGVGRPSTYASIMGTIQDRGYVWKKGSALVPSFVAFSVVTLLEQHFADLVDYAFTARMEDDLDEIASGDQEAIPWLRRFYFGNGREGLHDLVHHRLGEIDAREVNSIPLAWGAGESAADGDGQIVVRVGRYGPYLLRGEETVSIPEDMAPDELTPERVEELLAAPSGDRLLGEDPDTALPVYVCAGRFGPYVRLGDVEPGGDKPRTASLFKDMSPETVTIEEALRLLSLPRVLGPHPEDGEDVVALNGRYGPYIKKGSDTRSLEAEEQLFTIDLDGALALLAEPKRRRGQRAAAAPLRELGPDPATGESVVVKEGRFGPYVTDGTTNASLRKGDAVEDVTLERAAELLEERRQRAPVKKVARKRTAVKKAAKKKAPAKKTSTAEKAAKKQSS
ncbi:MAG: type I DNA topoisomerase, partial [Acidimicrobiia bacterium]|nr:type I DNA topoisomerase [Acidimicrobiia bacterium]